MRYITTATRRVTVGQYVRGVKLAKANPTAEFSEGLTCWWACTGEDIMKQFRKGMHQRITEGIPYHMRGI